MQATGTNCNRKMFYKVDFNIYLEDTAACGQKNTVKLGRFSAAKLDRF